MVAKPKDAVKCDDVTCTANRFLKEASQLITSKVMKKK
jgi:hypothetical protein